MPVVDTPIYPRILFFTGGTALRAVSRALADHTSSVTHVITTFDSGGSTAELRRSLAIPALGDLRNRMLALADPARLSPNIIDFFHIRLPAEGDNADLAAQVRAYTEPAHPIWQGVDADSVRFLTSRLSYLLDELPSSFTFHGASLGNFILAALYLEHRRTFAPMLQFLERFLAVRGTVLPVVEESLSLACELEDGTYLLGQHNFKKITQNIRRIFLTVHDPDRRSDWSTEDICTPQLSRLVELKLSAADIICYPMGSFYSSIVVNLLVKGVAGRIARSGARKIFIPNLGRDPELGTLNIVQQVDVILETLKRNAPCATNTDLLQDVLVDPRGAYHGRLDDRTEAELRERGICLRSLDLCGEAAEEHDPGRIVRALFSLHSERQHASSRP